MIWSLLDAAATRFAARVAIRHEDVELTYAELAAEAAGLAERLRAAGLDPGDRVAILANNCWEYLAAYFAAAGAGLVLVPWNTRLNVQEHRLVLEDSGADLLLAERKFEDVVKYLGVDVLWIDDEWPESCPLEEFEPAESQASTVAQLYYTSGTTGTPKGVMLTHGNVTAHVAMTVHELALDESDVWGHIAPMFHLADAWATFSITHVGGTHTFVPRFGAETALRAIARERITISNLVPTMLNLMVQEDGGHDSSSLRAILSGGAPIAPEVVRSIVERFGCEYVQTYGMTETSPFLTMSLLDDALRALPEHEQLAWRAKTGRAVRGVELRVVDLDGRDVANDEASVGEIWVRGPTVTPGYWQQTAATRDAFTADGWLKTGDLAVIDNKGFVTIVDRAKDVILTGGETVFSTEIENRLYEHPDVVEAAAIGLPDDVWGERIAAAVVLRGDSELTETALADFCRERLAGFKVPREIRFVGALPRTGSGKISKHSLRERWKV